MVPIVIDQVSKAINLCRMASLPDARGRQVSVTACFWAESGIGKTSEVRAYRDKWQAKLRETEGALEVGLDVHAMALEDALEFSGLPMPDRKTGRTRYFPQRRMPLVEPGGADAITPRQGVMLFDDIDKTRQDTMPGLYSILADHEVAGTAIKPLWFKVSCANGRAVDQLAEEMPRPLLARLVHFYVISRASALKKYATENGWNTEVLEALSRYGDDALPPMPMFEDMAVKTVDDSTPGKPSPRQWEYYSRVMNAMSPHMDYFADISFQAIQGCIGLEFASKEALRIATRGEIPTVSEILSGRARVPRRQYWHLLPMCFAMLGIPHRDMSANGALAAGYLKSCLDAGVSRDIVRLGVVCLSHQWPSIWSNEWALEFA